MATVLEIGQVLQRLLRVVDMGAAIVCILIIVIMVMKNMVGVLSDMLDDEAHPFSASAI